MREKVDRTKIDSFVEELSKRFRRPARVLLVGGTSLVFEGLRGQSVDMDVVLEVSPSEHGQLIQAIRELKDALSVNVEEASPADFIPLPSGYENRHQFLDRYGQIELFHFDLYSTALSKIERGRTQDMEDVLALLRASKIQWEQLANYFQEILPKVGEFSLKQNPIQFEANFRTLEAMWRA